MGLKEPVLLNDLVGWRHRGGGGAQVARVMDEGLRLLARPFSAGEATIVKPSNIVNPLIPAIMAMRPDARALFLYAPLEAYLASIARKGMWGRLWVRDLFGKLLREGMLGSLGIAPETYLGLTDLQVAAAGWLAQHQQFQTLAGTLNQRVATLNSETFVDRPGDTLGAVGRLFDLDLDPSAITAIINGPVFSRDAKNGNAFAPGMPSQASPCMGKNWKRSPYGPTMLQKALGYASPCPSHSSGRRCRSASLWQRSLTDIKKRPVCPPAPFLSLPYAPIRSGTSPRRHNDDPARHRSTDRRYRCCKRSNPASNPQPWACC